VGFFSASDELMAAASLEVEELLAVTCVHFTFSLLIGPQC
jgi:hypothetical protein